MPVNRRRVTWALSIALLLLLVFLMLRPRAVEVDTAVVRHGPLRTTVEGEARTRVRNLYVIAAPVGGSLQRIVLRPGDAVSRGAIVARIAPAPLDPQALARARAHLDAAVAVGNEAATRERQAATAAADARASVERLRALYQAGAVSQQEIRDADQLLRVATDDVNAAGSRVAAANAEVTAARAALVAVDEVAAGSSLVAVASPVTGQVLRVHRQSESVVQPGLPLAEIGDARDLEIVIDVLSTDAVRLTRGDRVELTGWGGDSTLTATVHLVEPSATTRISALGVEEQRVNVIARFTGEAAPLGDGFRADARIVNWESDSVLVVPMSALFRSQEGWSTYVVDQGKARLASVMIGHQSDAAAEILSGIADGTEVIMFPSDQIRDGVRVRRRLAGSS